MIAELNNDVDLAKVPRLLLRPDEAAAALAIGERKLWELTAGGKIRSVSVGRLKRYSIQALNDYIAESETT